MRNLQANLDRFHRLGYDLIVTQTGYEISLKGTLLKREGKLAPYEPIYPLEVISAVSYLMLAVPFVEKHIKDSIKLVS